MGSITHAILSPSPPAWPNFPTATATAAIAPPPVGFYLETRAEWPRLSGVCTLLFQIKREGGSERPGEEEGFEFKIHRVCSLDTCLGCGIAISCVAVTKHGESLPFLGDS